MKLIFSLFFILFSISVFSQRTPRKDDNNESNQSEAYHEQRVKLSVPPYGLAKVSDFIKKLKSDDEGNEVLNQAAYESLSLREKFTYHMIHAESYSQNCDAMPPIQNEHKKIFPYIAEAFNEAEWSERQTKFLSANRDSVMAIVRESILRSKRAGVNYKHLIMEINATELIPDLIAVYRASTKTKDLDILSLMMQLMKENEYEPFLMSPSYKKLYAEDADYRAYLNYNKANEDLIIKRAMDFYNANKK
ncbi:MAG TPA: hypothetical protein VI461_04900 [Chitinophagaceae bacterium]|nr:hypothetical protein [Chitinophagaceae bacterium]